MPPNSPTTIPTSFVPKQPVKTGGHFSQSGNNGLLFVAVLILGIVFLGAVGVFAGVKYFENVRDQKSKEVADIQANIDTVKVQEFIRARNRFENSQELLENHIVSSHFFDLLDTVTLQTVRFSNLSLSVAPDRSSTIDVEGVARTFNALAAQSSLLAGERQIKRAIFSNINIEDDKTVSFTLQAEIDSDLLLLSTNEVTAMEVSVPVATTTASTTPAVTSTTTPVTSTTTPRL